MAKSCTDVLEQGFNASKVESMEFIDSFLKQIREYTQGYVRRSFRDINSNLIRRFKEEFAKDENGVTRQWVLVEEPQIREMWKTCKADILTVFNHFKFIEIDYNAIEAFGKEENETPDGGDQIVEDKVNKKSLLNDKLLSEIELNRVKDRFNEDTADVLEEAIKKHVSNHKILNIYLHSTISLRVAHHCGCTASYSTSPTTISSG